MKILRDTNRDLKYGLLLRRTGQILVYAGQLIVLGLMSLLGVVIPSLEFPGVVSLLLGLVFVLGLFLSTFMAYKILYRGKQYEARGKAAPSEADTRQPVLYLRPFMLDEGSGGLIRRMIFGGGMWPVLFSVEEQLADAVASIGPLVAIGKPDEQLPTPGAVRHYFGDTTWQTVVQNWLSKARVIILRPGMSEGLWWELKEAVAAMPAESLLLLVLKMKRADYLCFSQLVNDRLDIRLPDFNEVSRWRRASGFIEFNAAWQARFLPLKASILRGEPYKPLKAAFNHTLQPMFTRLGVSWRPSPFSKFKLFAIGLLVLGLVLGTVGYLMSLRN
jgi:hypothetical protein